MISLMARWEGNARERLQKAAFELYARQGYDQTTVAEIAERAGLTKRTFFRHFADKREILFYGGAEMAELYRSTIAAAPLDISPFALVIAALETGAARIEAAGELARQRQALVMAHTELQERELLKLAALVTTIAAALGDRGVDETDALLAAETGMAAFRTAYAQWSDQPSRSDLCALLRQNSKRVTELS